MEERPDLPDFFPDASTSSDDIDLGELTEKSIKYFERLDVQKYFIRPSDNFLQCAFKIFLLKYKHISKLKFFRY